MQTFFQKIFGNWCIWKTPSPAFKKIIWLKVKKYIQSHTEGIKADASSERDPDNCTGINGNNNITQNCLII